MIEIQDKIIRGKNILTDIDNIKPHVKNFPEFIERKLAIDMKELSISKEMIIDYQDNHKECFCAICFSLLRNPVCCWCCEALICFDCIQESMRLLKDKLFAGTPFKKVEILSAFKNILCSIKFLCLLECQDTINMSLLDSHLEKCEKRINYLECSLCNERFYDKTGVRDHKSICEGIILKCPICEKDYKSNKYNDH